MQVRKPSWWQLYILVFILPAAVLLEQIYPLPGFSAGEVDGGILVLIFVALVGWVQVNAGLIERYEAETHRGRTELKITVYAPHKEAAEAWQDTEITEVGEPHELTHDAIHSGRRRMVERGTDDRWSLN